MPSKIKTDLGTISIENEVIAHIAGLAATECYGIVGMAAKNVKDGIVQLLKKESLTKGIQFTLDGESLVFDLYIVVEYGTNISAICESLVSAVQYKVEEFVGIPVAKVNVFVEDVRVDA